MIFNPMMVGGNNQIEDCTLQIINTDGLYVEVYGTNKNGIVSEKVYKTDAFTLLLQKNSIVALIPSYDPGVVEEYSGEIEEIEGLGSRARVCKIKGNASYKLYLEGPIM